MRSAPAEVYSLGVGSLLDLSELSAVTPTATDSFATLDSDGSTEQRTTITDLSSFQAGSGLSASSGVLSVDSITSVGAVDSGSITSGFGSIDTGSSAITTTGDLSVGDATVTGGDLSFGNGQHATVSVAAVSATVPAGKSLTAPAGLKQTHFADVIFTQILQWRLGIASSSPVRQCCNVKADGDVCE